MCPQDGNLEDASSGEPFNLCGMWGELISGRLQITDQSSTASSFLLLLRPMSLRVALDSRRARAVERALCGVSQKVIAMELGTAPSTAALLVKEAFAYLGVSCGMCNMPFSLVMIARAHFFDADVPAARMVPTEHDGFEQLLLDVPRPETQLQSVLPPAEYEVVRLLVEGNSYSRIAAQRGTSVRTVANQLCAAWRRFGVSGRTQLMCRLLTGRDATIAQKPVAGNARNRGAWQRSLAQRSLCA